MLFTTVPFAAHADVKLPPLFSEHAVVQKSGKAAVWGTADPGGNVTLTLSTTNAKTTAGGDGKWRADLHLSGLGQGPFDLVVQGKNIVTIHDVLVGEVWLASGQSNMAFDLVRSAGGNEEIAASANLTLQWVTGGRFVFPVGSRRSDCRTPGPSGFAARSRSRARSSTRTLSAKHGSGSPGRHRRTRQRPSCG